MKPYLLSGIALLALAACQPKEAQTPETVEAPAQTTATPPAEVVRTATKQAYFGDLHVHTKNSFDAFIFGTRTTPDDAYRFAKGAAIDNGAGHEIKLSGPALDFYAVTDHGEYIGVIPAMRDKKSPISKTKTAKSIFGLLATDRRESFLGIGRTVVNGEEIADIYNVPFMNAVWADTVAAAERHNNPGTFTTFAGYEFTAMVQVTDNGAANLHRNVIFEDEAPEQIFTTLNSINPENLWSWMDEQRAEGRELLAIPHNSNASNGLMFARTDYEGGEMTTDYAAARLRNEPLVEITQVKGTSETHPALSPADEFAGFEQYEYLIGSTDLSAVDAGSFVRNALARGLAKGELLGVNPYEFGVIGSSDTHLGATSLSEEDHFGKFPHDLDPEVRQSIPPKGAKNWDGAEAREVDLIATPQYGASGLAGVWAEANTREDLFASMRARETFGTSGPRLQVRFFAGQDYDEDMLTSADVITQAYARGVPMGSKIPAGESSPDFFVWAAQDPASAPLQRVQIIKVLDGAEEIHDVACAGGEAPNPETQRCAGNGADVDLETCALTGSGAAELKTIWKDANWQAGQKAAYYVRVLENPKCRWSTWDAVRNGTPPSPAMAKTIQDRAWSSAIWTE